MATVMDGAGIVVDHPVRRADYEELTPAILAERPAPGEGVRDPLRIDGTANTFEATFQVEPSLVAMMRPCTPTAAQWLPSVQLIPFRKALWKRPLRACALQLEPESVLFRIVP